MTDEQNTPDLFDALSRPEDERGEALFELIREAEEARSTVLWEFDRDRAFVRGDHYGRRMTGARRYAHWDAGGGRAPAEVRKWRRTVNHCGKVSAVIRSLMTQERPHFGVMAGSSEGADRGAAKAAKLVLQWVQRRHEIDTVYANCSQGAHDVGTRFLHVVWDKSGGGLVETPITEERDAITEKVADPSSGEMIDMIVEPAQVVQTGSEWEPSGDVRFIEREPEEILVPAQSVHNRDPDWLCVKEFVSLAKAQEMFPDRAEELTVGLSDHESTFGIYGKSNLPGIGRNSFYDFEELVLIYTIYVKRCDEYPRGRKLVMNKGLLLEEEDNPVYPTEDEPQEWWPNFHYPVIPFRWILDPKAFYGISGTSQIVDLQRDINGYYSKCAIIAAKISHARRKVPSGTRFLPTDDPMAIIEYQATKGPDSIQWENPPQFPNELLTLIQQAKTELDEISGVVDALQGLARAEDSGVKNRQQRQSAMGRLGEIKARHDRDMARALLLAVNLLRRHLDTEQVMLVVGENNRTVVETFKQANLTSMIDVYPVNNPLSSDPSRRMLEMQQVVQMLGQVQDPVLATRIIAALNLENILQLQDEMSVHREKALNEDTRLSRGEMVNVDPFDDDMTHIAVHSSEHLSEEGQSANPQVQQMRVQHIQQHMAQMQQKMQGAPSPAPTQGGAPQPGEPQPSGTPPQQGSLAAPQQPVA